jgi:hypothetical protein
MHRSYYDRLTYKAQHRKIEVEISSQDIWDQWVLQNGKCALTGWPLTLKSKARDYRATASLDRIDSDGPYTRDNIQWVHKDVNRLKNNFNETRFFELCRAVADHKDETKRLRGSRPWLRG